MRFLKHSRLLKIATIIVAAVSLAIVINAISQPNPAPIADTSAPVQANATTTAPVQQARTAAIKAKPVTSIDAKLGSARLYPNPTLTTGNVLTTDTSQICTSGYTATVRDVPLSVKKEVYAEYGVAYPQPTGSYEVDHFIPLELGGSNDIKNLWLEPASPTPGFHQKDQFEDYEHHQICSAKLSLEEAQRRMATDWYRYWLQETGSAAVSSRSSTTTQAAAPIDDSEPEVKKSSTGICHEKGTTYYDRTTNYTAYDSLDVCLASGGRLPSR